MQYGIEPAFLGIKEVDCREMMFYQYLPIKMIGSTEIKTELRLSCFSSIIGEVCCDFIGTFGIDRYVESYVYLTAKRQYQQKGCSFNREGWHSDGFMTDDINYIWADKYPTVFNFSDFHLSMDDSGSLIEMQEQAKPEWDYSYPDKSLLRLNQYSIHRVADIKKPSMRTFLKISFSKDKYDLEGNSHNYLFNYNWEMKPRKWERNIPQTLTSPPMG